MAGLTAAHELSERGVAVTVIERRAVAGGKARSFPVAGTGPTLAGSEGRPPLPAEHGFRVFPAFYRNLPDTMGRIPSGTGTVVDRLVPTARTELYRDDGRSYGFDLAPMRSAFARLERAQSNLGMLVGSEFASFFDAQRSDVAFLLRALLRYLTACDARRTTQLDAVSWERFAIRPGADRFGRLMGNNLWQLFVAVRGSRMSASTAAGVWTRLTLDRIGASEGAVRVLDGPTSEAWIDPWVQHLSKLGVRFRFEEEVVGFARERARITGVRLADGTVALADAYVCTLPVEVFRRIALPDLAEADPALDGLRSLEVGWMNGVQLYFDRPLGWSRGHRIFLDSPWAITALSQGSLWRSAPSRFGDGRVGDIVSVDISNFDAAGIVHGRAARDASEPEIVEEVMAQLAAHLRGEARARLLGATLLHAAVDPALSTGGPHPHNDEPLFINTVGSWAHRPEATTAIENLFLASDYVRSAADLASMEGANEAARKAANGTLAYLGRPGSRASVERPVEPAVFAPLRKLDAARFARGLGCLFA